MSYEQSWFYSMPDGVSDAEDAENRFPVQGGSRWSLFPHHVERCDHDALLEALNAEDIPKIRAILVLADYPIPLGNPKNIEEAMAIIYPLYESGDIPRHVMEQYVEMEGCLLEGDLDWLGFLLFVHGHKQLGAREIKFDTEPHNEMDLLP